MHHERAHRVCHLEQVHVLRRNLEHHEPQDGKLSASITTRIGVEIELACLDKIAADAKRRVPFERVLPFAI